MKSYCYSLILSTNNIALQSVHNQRDMLHGLHG